MKVSTFDDDLLGLDVFAHRLEKFIAVEHQYVEGSLVIGLSSKFGSGKSSFLQMWMSSLESAEEKDGKPLVILLNAWESDYYGDPLYAIISALVSRLEKEGEPAEKLINAAKDFGLFATAIGGQVVKKVTGIDAVAAGEHTVKKKKKREDKLQSVPDTFSSYEGRKNAMSSLKGAIQEFVEGTEPRVLFLVDELDRCRPDYAISYLETIKHIFDVNGAVFLLAADRQQLENSARSAFGDKLDFDEYYRKFVHREVTLPDISDDNYNKLASKYVTYYLEGGGSRNCFMELGYQQIKNIIELVGALKLTPRQIQEVFRILGHILETTEDKKGKLFWCLGVGSVMMSAFKVGKPKIFRLLGTQQLKPKEAYDLFNDLLGSDNIDWWFTLCLTGGGLKTEEGEKTEDIFRNVGLLKEDHEFIHLGQWSQGWGHSRSSGLSEAYDRIEHLSQWV